MTERDLLEVRGLEVAYDGVRALHGVDLVVRTGEIVALVGSNGAGKSTLLRAISGVVRPQAGSILFEGLDLTRVGPHETVERGLVQVPEGRRIFAQASVRDNLLLGAHVVNDSAEKQRRFERACALFPVLGRRARQRAGTLSGGEQQMLAIARGMMSNPKLLMLDEPSLGIAPKLLPDIFGTVQRVASEGATVLLVEQNVRDALELADRAYVLQTGRIVMEGPARDLLQSDTIKRAYLGL